MLNRAVEDDPELSEVVEIAVRAWLDEGSKE